MKLDPLSYYELLASPARGKRLFTDHERALLSDFFSSCGIPRLEIVFMEGPEKSAAAVYTRSLKKRNSIRQKFKKIFPRGFRFKEKLLVREDWFDKWQQDYGIMPLGKKFTLVPDWKRSEYQPGKRRPLFLDPQGVSGSGQHPTTQMMADLLERIEGKFDSCLDLGTGTGILGILAAKLGGGEVTATDIDRRAVKAARHNFKLNRLPRASAVFEDVTKTKKRQKYDLVCANLISPVLEKIKLFLFESVRPEGYLAVSGIHVLNFPAFNRKFRHSKFRCLKIVKRRGWTSLLFKKTR